MPLGAVEIPGLRLEDELGRGAYSIVFRARRGHRACAVKIARRGGRSARWFRREAAALARVRHPGIPEVLDVGEVEGRPYLVMELVEGETLADRLQRSGFSVADTIELGLELANIVAAVHDHGLVHRDIKPRNIIIERGGRIRLVDFGLVTQLHPVLASDETAGTRSYAAPEQLHAPQLVDGRADLYAIGRVLQDCSAHLSDVPNRLKAIVEKLLARQPSERYPSARILIRELEQFRPERQTSDPPPTEDDPILLFGREREQLVLRERWDKAKAGLGSVVLLDGPPGAGKSRLLRSFVRARELENDGLVFDARGGSAVPLATVRQLVEGFLDRLEAASKGERTRGENQLRSVAEGPLAALVASISPRLGAILGNPPTPREREHEAFVEATADLFVRLARASGGMLIAIDDLQWLDPLSREVVVRVALGADSAPLLFVATARTDTRSLPPLQRFARSLGPDRLRTLTLGPLRDSDIERLVASHLGTDDLDPVLTRRVVALADGTPLGALEIVSALVDGGALWPHWGSWRFEAPIAEQTPLPRSTAGLLERRVAQIPPATIRILQAAAVLGPEIEADPVCRSGGIGSDDLGIALVEASRAGLVELDPAGKPRFVHETVREALLRPLSAEDKRSLHQSIAEALDQIGANDFDTLFAAASHFALGEPDRMPTRVYAVTRAAAERAAASLDHETALRFFALAQDSAQRIGQDLDVEFFRAVAESQIRIGAFDDALTMLDRALQRATGIERAALLGRVAWVHQIRAVPDRAWATLEQAFAELGERLPDERPRALSGTLLGAIHKRVTSHVAPPHERERLGLLCELHYQNARLGVEYGKPLRIFQSALAILRIGDRLGPSTTMALAYAMHGMFTIVLGRKRAGRRYLELAHEMAKSVGDPFAIARTVQFSFASACWVGDIDRALELARQCLDTYGHWLEVTEYSNVAATARLLESVRGRPDEALAWLRRALDRVRRHGRPPGVLVQLLVPPLRATLATLGRERELPRYLEYMAAAEGDEPTRGVYRLVGWGPRALLLAEADHTTEDSEALRRSFAAESHNPRFVHPMVGEYYVAIAHVHAREYESAAEPDATRSMDRFERALVDLGKAARIPLYRAHLEVLEGYRALFKGDHEGARKRFLIAEGLADSETAPWVQYLAARGEARLLLLAGKRAAARDKARVAELLAKTHGAVHRVRRIQEEFDLRSSSSDAQIRGDSPQSTSSSRRQLRALLQVVEATAKEQRLEPQAVTVLDELIRASGADRGLLLFERPERDGSRLLAGRTGSGENWVPHDPSYTALLKRVSESGQAAIAPDRIADPGEGVPIDLRRAIAIPLLLHAEVVGALYLERSARDPAFSEDEAELMSILAPQVPIALELARLFEERAQLQENLRQAQKMEAVGQLASGIAHDFNNMLTAIQSAVEVLNKGADSDQKVLLEIIRSSSRRSADLVRQLLAFSRRQLLKTSVLDINEILTSLMPMLKRLIGPQVEIVLLGTEGSRYVTTDRSSLEQAIVNLAVNARDAMPNGGCITIEATEVTFDETWLARGAQRPGRHACIRVTDTGMGIATEILEKVFEPFFTTKRIGVGTGLGLASVYGFMKQSGGHIDVQSEVGVGSTFALYLPISDHAPERPSTRAPTSAATIHQPSTILIVDDERLVCAALAAKFRAEGYQVHTAIDGSEAIALVRSGTRIDLVITDVLMPNMTGPELVGHITALGLAAPVLYMSGYTDGHLVEQGVLQKGVAFMQKPFDLGALIARARELLAQRPTDDVTS